MYNIIRRFPDSGIVSKNAVHDLLINFLLFLFLSFRSAYKSKKVYIILTYTNE